MVNLALLPPAVSDSYAWQEAGRCRQADPDDFFSPDLERGELRAAREARAKAWCRGCPVRAACLDHALSAYEPDGVWGGTTAHEREAIIRRENRHRPTRVTRGV